MASTTSTKRRAEKAGADARPSKKDKTTDESPKQARRHDKDATKYPADELCQRWQNGWHRASDATKDNIVKMFRSDHKCTVEDVDKLIARHEAPKTKDAIDLSKVTFVPFDHATEVGTSNSMVITRHWITYDGNESALKKLPSLIKRENDWGTIISARN